MSEAQDRIAAACAVVADAARSAIDWIEDPQNAGLVGAQRASLAARTRRAARRAERLARSARTPVSVTVYGASQAGKSTMLGALCVPPGGTLHADFGGPGGQLHFRTQLDPGGGKESTAIVTRFTMARRAGPTGFPVCLHLLSESDVICVIVNSFFNEGDKSEEPPTADALARHAADWRARAGAPVAGLASDDVLDVADYVKAGFRGITYAEALAPFWDDAAAIAPRLAPADRAAFLAPLWGGHAALGDLYRRLAEALATVGHADTVWATLDALQPREESIMSVATLRRFYDPAAAAPVRLATESGAQASLPRTTLCALVAELVLPIRDRPAPFFDSADMLDFPGARTREEQTLELKLRAVTEFVPDMLLRGKVAYLFDRYVANQELTFMVLCVGRGNMETKGLPELIDRWIITTAGTDPVVRGQVPCGLFFVMTMFDLTLADDGSGLDATARFENRVFQSLCEKFGRGRDPWVDHWDGTGPFRNAFWFRDTNRVDHGSYVYEAAGDGLTEGAIQPAARDRFAALERGYMEAASVRRHFDDAAAAWRAAIAAGDGGRSRLTEALARTCRPETKAAQLRVQLDRVRAEVARDLAPFHVADDIEARIEARRAAAWQVVDGIEAALQQQRLGAMLRALTVSQDTIEDRIARIPPHVRLSAAGPAPAEAGPEPMARPLFIRRPDGAPAAAPAATAAPVRMVTLEAFQAETAIEVWIEALNRFRDDAGARAAFRMGDQAAADLVSELIHASRRLNLAGRMATALADLNYGLTIDRVAPAAAILCAEYVNRFAMTLGHDALPEKERPHVPLDEGGTRPVFARPPGSDDAQMLPAVPRPAATELATDWAFAVEALFVANAQDVQGSTRNIEQNRRIGAVLRQVEAA